MAALRNSPTGEAGIAGSASPYEGQERVAQGRGFVHLVSPGTRDRESAAVKHPAALSRPNAWQTVPSNRGRCESRVGPSRHGGEGTSCLIRLRPGGPGRKGSTAPRKRKVLQILDPRFEPGGASVMRSMRSGRVEGPGRFVRTGGLGAPPGWGAAGAPWTTESDAEAQVRRPSREGRRRSPLADRGRSEDRRRRPQLNPGGASRRSLCGAAGSFDPAASLV